MLASMTMREKRMNLQVSNSPHIRDKATTKTLMRDVLIALLPATVASGIIFGLRSILLILFSVLSCMILEYVCRKIMKRDNTLWDLSAVITGVLLAFNLPPTLPYYMVFVGAFFAIVVVKQMFGGLGNNFVNPALTARIILLIAFPKAMTQWTLTDDSSFHFLRSIRGADLVSQATPLALLRSQGADAISHATSFAALKGDNMPTFLTLFLGDKAGCLGEVSILALLIGAAYLLIRKVITPYIPVAYIGTVFLISLFIGSHPITELFQTDLSVILYEPVYMILSGGLILGAFFMATDYVTSPITTKGRIIFGIGCGIITVMIRFYGNIAEGVSFSIVIMNILTPHIDRFTMPKPFGEVKKHAKA